MDEAGEFIDMISYEFCAEMNAAEMNLDFYTSDDDEQEYKVIEDNMMIGKKNSQKKFSDFALDKSKRDDLKQALNDLENHGVDLNYFFNEESVHDYYDDCDLPRKHKVVIFLITRGYIHTFKDLFNAFEPNGLKL